MRLAAARLARRCARCRSARARSSAAPASRCAARVGAMPRRTLGSSALDAHDGSGVCASLQATRVSADAPPSRSTPGPSERSMPTRLPRSDACASCEALASSNERPRKRGGIGRPGERDVPGVSESCSRAAGVELVGPPSAAIANTSAAAAASASARHQRRERVGAAGPRERSSWLAHRPPSKQVDALHRRTTVTSRAWLTRAPRAPPIRSCWARTSSCCRASPTSPSS